MAIVSRVFAQILTRARTPEEIAEVSGVSISKVREVLAFLKEFGFIDEEGRRVKVVDEIAVSPDD